MFRQKLKFLFLAFVSLYIYSQHAQSEPAKYEIYTESHMYGHSETSAIKQIVFDDFEGSDYAGGKRSFTYNVWEVGVRYEDFKIAAIARYDYDLNYTEDVAELVYADKNDKRIETNREYDLYLDVLHARSYGFKMGYEFLLSPFITMGIDLSALKLASFMDGAMHGNIVVGEDSYDGDIYLDYVYSKDKLLDRVHEKPKGQGYALDVRWAFQVNDRFNIDAEILDLFSQIEIDRAPFTSAKASSNRINLDTNGQIDVKPVLAGRESYRKHTLRLAQKMSLEGRYLLQNGYTAGIRFDRYDKRAYTSVLLNIPFRENQELQTAYDFRTKAVTLGWHERNWNFAITSDQLEVSKARTFGLSFSLISQL